MKNKALLVLIMSLLLVGCGSKTPRVETFDIETSKGAVELEVTELTEKELKEQVETTLKGIFEDGVITEVIVTDDKEGQFGYGVGVKLNAAIDSKDNAKPYIPIMHMALELETIYNINTFTVMIYNGENLEFSVIDLDFKDIDSDILSNDYR